MDYQLEIIEAHSTDVRLFDNRADAEQAFRKAVTQRSPEVQEIVLFQVAAEDDAEIISYWGAER